MSMCEYKYTSQELRISPVRGGCTSSGGNRICDDSNQIDNVEETITCEQTVAVRSNSENNSSGESFDKDGVSASVFDGELTNLWDEAMKNDLFRYKLKKNCLPAKILPGCFQYLSQLNPDRAEKRRKPQEIKSGNQPFDPNEFNFNKVDSKEILISLKPWYSSEADDEHLLLINVSPLEYGHVLLTPFRNRNRPQIVTKEGLRLAIELCLLSNSCDFRVGFNSLCGFASVNHEHYHAYYLSHRLYIEHAVLMPLSKNCMEVRESRFPPGFCFVLNEQSGESRKEEAIADVVMSVLKLTENLQDRDVGHNIFVTRASTKNVKGHFDSIRIFLWARTPSYGAKGCEAFNPALCELAGHFPIKSDIAYEKISEDYILNELHGICDEPFRHLREWIIANY